MASTDSQQVVVRTYKRTGSVREHIGANAGSHVKEAIWPLPLLSRWYSFSSRC